MQPNLEPKEMIGKTIKRFELRSYRLVIEVEGGGYITIDPAMNWDDAPELKEGPELKFREQFSEGMISGDEYKQLLIEDEERKAELAAKKAIETVALDKVKEKAVMYQLMLKYPQAAKAFVDAPDYNGHVDYTGTPVRPVGEVATEETPGTQS